jgi:hypothetical protein
MEDPCEHGGEYLSSIMLMLMLMLMLHNVTWIDVWCCMEFVSKGTFPCFIFLSFLFRSFVNYRSWGTIMQCIYSELNLRIC